MVPQAIGNSFFRGFVDVLISAGMSHGSSLQLSKLHLFLHPSQHLLAHYYDPHVYVFAHATLKIFDQPTLRHTLYSIRVGLAEQGKHLHSPFTAGP